MLVSTRGEPEAQVSWLLVKWLFQRESGLLWEAQTRRQALRDYLN